MTGRTHDPAEQNSRHSNGLEQFFEYIRDETGLTILDLGGANQANISFVTNLGHKLYSEDLLRNLRHYLAGSKSSEPIHPDQVREFLSQNVNYPPHTFDGVLVWDILEYLEPPLLNAVVERFRSIVKPGSYLLSVFHAQDKVDVVPQYSYRIHDAKTLLLSLRSRERTVQAFNNRNLERLFQGFASLKFFLTRDNLREVIVKR